MYQLICDKCGKRISSNEKVIEIHLEEKIYEKGFDYYRDKACLETSITLCGQCGQYLYEVLNLYNDRF